VVPGTLEINEILVELPEQMDSERGLLVTEGTALVKS
jgi:hypothetical protein